MEKRYAVLNALSIPVVLFVNYYTQAIELNGNTMQTLSNKYYNLFTPAAYAFAIWGIIYLALTAMVVFQLYQVFGPRKKLVFIRQMGPWLFIANIANAAWVTVWLYEYTGLSVLIMVFLLFSLLRIVHNTNMERWDAPFAIIAFYWWPICLYSGWVTVALIANISAFLAKMEWKAFGITESIWTMIMIAVAVVINLLMVRYRNMREYAAVAIWALIAIALRHSESHNTITLAAYSGAAILFLYVAYHGFVNRYTNPVFKMLNKDKSG